MNKKILGGVLIGLVVIIGVIFLFRKSDRGSVEVKQSETPMSLEQRLAHDGGVLEEFVASGGQGERYAIYEAVLRLSRMKKPVALKAALLVVESEDKLWREAAAQALGSYDDEQALQALEILMEDKEPSVKMFARQSLGKAKTPARAEYIKKKIEAGELSTLEQIDLLTSYVIATGSTGDRSWGVSRLEKMARDGDSKVADAATLRLLQVAGRDKETLELLKRKMKTSKNEQVLGKAVRMLSVAKDPWLMKNFVSLLDHESPLVRKATIQAVRRSCPQNYWDMLTDRLKKEQNKSVVETLVREAVLLSGPAAVRFLNQVKEQGVHDRAKTLVEDGLTQLGPSPKPGPCG